jgi:hypothetical protein
VRFVSSCKTMRSRAGTYQVDTLEEKGQVRPLAPLGGEMKRMPPFHTHSDFLLAIRKANVDGTIASGQVDRWCRLCVGCAEQPRPDDGQSRGEE